MRRAKSYLLVLIVLTTTLASHVTAAQPVQVRLDDGRLLTADVDPRTDDTALWLRFRYSSMSLSAAYAWSRVRQVQVGDQQMSAEEFRQVVDELKTPEPEEPAVDSRPAPEGVIVIPRRRELPNEATRVASLWVSARLANWDRDAEMDGLEICIAPLNRQRQLILAHGQLRITLLGRRNGLNRDPQVFPDLGRWSVRVDAGDFEDGCAVYRLPFRRLDPQQDLTVHPEGLLQARLNVYGQGTFAAETTVLLRIFNPVRDGLRKLDER